MWWIAVVRIRICRIVRIYRIVTMRCIVITLTFDSSPIKGEGDWRLVCLVHPCRPAALWIPAYAGMTVRFGCVGLLLPCPSPLDCGSSPQ